VKFIDIVGALVFATALGIGSYKFIQIFFRGLSPRKEQQPEKGKKENDNGKV
jgi:hypothetical protein